MYSAIFFFLDAVLASAAILVGTVPLESRISSVPDDRYAVSNGSGYAVLICWDEYVVLDRELDTPYSMEVDTPYSTVDQNIRIESSGYGVLIFIPEWSLVSAGTDMPYLP
ncbi:hypothetical protein Tco_1404987 [Tanacetum coccineum]